MKHNGQLAMEFLLFMGMAFCVVVVLLASILSVSNGNTKIKAYNDMDDLGKSLQGEFLLAARLEDGYTRKLNLPMTMDGVHYNTTIGSSNPRNSYFILSYDQAELFYMIPPVQGNITLGDNLLTKNNGTLRVN